MGVNPLRGANGPEPGFVDQTEVYDRTLIRLMRRAGRLAKTVLHSGVYLAVSGPTYETPSEIRAFGLLGADAVGMSTVPEAIVARQCGLKVAALSCITNLAAGRSKGPISHQEVLTVGKTASSKVTDLLKHFVQLSSKTSLES